MRKRRLAAVTLLLWLVCSGITLAAETATYVVQPGDTLYSLARRYDTTVAALAAANGLDDSYLIRVGQKLRVPVGEKTAVGAPALQTAGSSAATGARAGQGALVRSSDEAASLFSGGVDRGAVVGRPPAAASSTVVLSAGPAVQPAQATPVSRVEAAPADTPVLTQAAAASPAPGRVIEVTEQERLLLARLVVAEAGNEPVAGQLGVAAVVVNRVRHPAFPKSVEAVVDEPGQFKSVELGRLANVVPSEAVFAVVDRALAGEDPTGGALFFYNPAKSVALDFWKTRPVVAVIGGHNFAR